MLTAWPNYGRWSNTHTQKKQNSSGLWEGVETERILFSVTQCCIDEKEITNSHWKQKQRERGEMIEKTVSSRWLKLANTRFSPRGLEVKQATFRFHRGELKQETVTVQPIKGHFKKKQIVVGTLRKICIVKHICTYQKLPIN